MKNRQEEFRGDVRSDAYASRGDRSEALFRSISAKAGAISLCRCDHCNRGKTRLVTSFWEETSMRVMVLVFALLVAFSSMAASGAPAPVTLLADGWRQYKERFVTSEGRVVDNANGGIRHSEGQGYAVLISGRLDYRPTVEAIWQWAQAQLFVRCDRL